jgi:hypothetical protein
MFRFMHEALLIAVVHFFSGKRDRTAYKRSISEIRSFVNWERCDNQGVSKVLILWGSEGRGGCQLVPLQQIEPTLQAVAASRKSCSFCNLSIPLSVVRKEQKLV